MPQAVCIGGPYDGRSIAYGGNAFEVREELPDPFLAPPEPMPTDLAIRTLGLYAFDGEFWIWNPYG